jgi:hypothetical protein
VENRRRKFRGVEKPENWREAGRPIFRAGAHQCRRRIGAGGRLKLVLIILEEEPVPIRAPRAGATRTSLAKAHREIAVSIRAPGAGATRISPAKAHREIAVSIRAPGAGATRTSLAKAHRKIAVSIRAPGAGATRTSLAKAHHEIAVSIGAPRAGATDTNYSGYGTDCALTEKAVFRSSVGGTISCRSPTTRSNLAQEGSR